MLDVVHRFETLINWSLLVVMALIVALTTVSLGWSLIQQLSSPPYFQLSDAPIGELFAGLLLVLIGLELLHTVRAYMADRTVHVELVLAVGLVAITRKIILIDAKTLDGLWLIGVAALIAALAASYYVVTGGRRAR
jgi:uncharacterized membrane protein (DUF373 family)